MRLHPEWEPIRVPEAFLSTEAGIGHPPSAPIDAAPLPVPALPEPQGPNFCSTCGSRWQAGWVECPVCAARQTARAAQRAEPDRSPVAPSLALYFTLLATSVVGLIAGMAGLPEVRLLTGISLADSVIILAWAIWARREVVPALIRPVSPGWLLVGPLAGSGTFLIATGMVKLLHWGIGIQEIRMTDGLLNAGHGWTFVILLICVQPALFEELGFRGVILPSLQPTLAMREAVVVSSLLFMTLHLSIASFPHLFLLGLVLGYLRARTGSLLPGMLMHFTHNLLCVLAEHRWV